MKSYYLLALLMCICACNATLYGCWWDGNTTVVNEVNTGNGGQEKEFFKTDQWQSYLSGASTVDSKNQIIYAHLQGINDIGWEQTSIIGFDFSNMANSSVSFSIQVEFNIVWIQFDSSRNYIWVGSFNASNPPPFEKFSNFNIGYVDIASSTYTQVVETSIPPTYSETDETNAAWDQENLEMVYGLYYSEGGEISSLIVSSDVSDPSNVITRTFQPLTYAMQSMAYINGIYYGLIIDGTINANAYWGSVDIITGQITKISSLPQPFNEELAPVFTTDGQTTAYMVLTNDSDNSCYYVAITMESGVIESSGSYGTNNTAIPAVFAWM